MTTNPPEKIVDRVRKLLRLAGNAGSDAEAAAAAARAAALMAEHAITEAQASIAAGEDRPAEPIVHAPVDPDRTRAACRRVAWRESIALGVARTLGVRVYHQGSDTGSRMVGLGRERACQTWQYTTAYLAAQIDRLADDGWRAIGGTWGGAGASARAWKNAFRLGAAQRVASRLYDVASEQHETARAATAAAQAIVAAGTPGAHDLALVRVDRERQEVTEAYDAMFCLRRRSSASSVGQTSSYGGLAAGRAAGDRVSLGGGARASLPAGRGRLK